MHMPGPDLFTERRAVLLRKYLGKGPRMVLDCGCGNGWFSYMAYKSGARVLGISLRADEVEKAREMYNVFMGLPKDKMDFQHMNAYEMGTLNLDNQVDEIICFETLEHIKEDRRVCEIFYKMLKKNGVLHLSCPNSRHPRWQKEQLDIDSRWSGHVREGYTMDSYRALLEPLGFEIVGSEGMGNQFLSSVSEFVRWFNKGPVSYYLYYLLSAIFSFVVIFDKVSESSAFCIYVKCRKK